jgi:hypothetical protein
MAVPTSQFAAPTKKRPPLLTSLVSAWSSGKTAGKRAPRGLTKQGKFIAYRRNRLCSLALALDVILDAPLAIALVRPVPFLGFSMQATSFSTQVDRCTPQSLWGKVACQFIQNSYFGLPNG